MRYEQIVGQQEPKQRLLKMVKEERVPHALLFSGREGCGNLPAALAFAQHLYCTQKQESGQEVAIVLTERIGGFNLKVFDVVAAGQIPYTDAFHRLAERHHKIILSSIERVGMTAYQNKQVSELSDGMFQKMIIAKALAQQTKVMLLDEPSAFLDYASKHNLFQLLQELAVNENKSILVSSHDLEILLKYCHDLLVIHEQEVSLMPAHEAMNNEMFLKVAGGFLPKG